ncbi:Ddl-like protein [Planctomycetes bacterium Poly30]|uniref:Ddl-like protein n=1 Tax=Saltatorellus ferox TaxID=2528018 RepID=A0A518EW75_9BACT|nr:Ddl-like protein [Planctomycetes bacterium Poly30]
MHVLIVFDEPAAGAGADQLDVMEQVVTVEAGLKKLGHTFSRLGLSADLPGVCAALAASPGDIVFNLAESFAGRGRLIHLVPTLLEALGRPFTGASAASMFMSSSKLVAKRMLSAAGLPTPDWYESGWDEQAPEFTPGRFIVKSVWEHASIGLDEDSVVEAEDGLDLEVALNARLTQLGGEGFVERFIDGREFNLSVIAMEPGKPVVLAPAEILFEGYDDAKPKVVGYRAKWDPESFEYQHTPRSFDFGPADRKLLARLRELALQAWSVMQLSGWARVDFRVDENGEPWILEVNANPCLSPDAGFAAALQESDMSLSQAIDCILRDSVSLPGPT